MAYTKTTLISRPIESSYGMAGALGDITSTIKGGVSSVLDMFGAGLKAQGAAQQSLEMERIRAEADKKKAAAAGGVPTTYLVVGGLALAGVLVFALRKK